MSKEKYLVNIKDLKNFYFTKNNKRWIEVALNRKIVPLKASPLLANLCGHLIGDGNLQLRSDNGGHIRFYGIKEKLISILEDYHALFSKKVKLTKRTRIFDPGYRLDITDSTVARCLHLIGVPIGDKVITKFEVPNWILGANKEIKRNFLQAIFDDELEKICRDKKKPNTWRGFKFKMSKSEKLVNNMIKFFKQIKFMLEEFDIESTEIKISKSAPFQRKDGIKTKQVYFRIRNNVENRRKFYNGVGFSRNKRKQKLLIKSLA